MIEEVVKRDGTIQKYDWHKIVNAINKAVIAVDGELNNDNKQLAYDVVADIHNSFDFVCCTDRKTTVEEIQDMVERGLMRLNGKDVAKAYILYRDKRSRERESKSKLMKAVADRLTAKNIQNQNANVDESSFGGRRGEALAEMMKQYALDYCMSKKSKYNHLNNRIYVHDLDSYALGMHNCLSIPFDDLLAKGFNTRQTDVRPAQSVSTAFQLVAVLFQIQSLQQFGKNLCRV